MPFLLKVLISAILIAFVSWLAGRQTILAGFMIALPVVSMLAILFSYIEYRDMEKINQFAVSILVAVPLSLTFFIPFLLNKWLKMSFLPTYFLGIAFLTLTYFIHQLVFKTNLFR